MAKEAGGVRPDQGPALPPDPAAARVGALPLRAAWLVLGIAFVVHLRQWVFLCDDAYISFRYARNLARHGALVFNVDPIEYVEGYTNLFWVLLLALGDAIGVSPPALAPVLTGLSSFVALVLVVWLVRRLRAQVGESAPTTNDFGLTDLVPAALLVALPEFVVWGSGGLETSLAIALVLGAMVAWMHGRLELAAGLSALAGLTRLDALLPIAAFGLAWLAVVGVRRRRVSGEIDVSAIPWRRVAIAAAVFVVPIGGQFLWRHAYYGQWMPNTWAIKQYGRLLSDTVGREYVSSWVENVRLWWLAPLLVMLRLRHLVFVLPIAVVLYYVRSVGGDFMGYSRFLLPATVLLAALVGWLLADLQDWISRRLSRPLPVGLVLGVALAGAMAWDAHARSQIDDDNAWIPAHRGDEKGRWEGVRGMDEFARKRVAAGDWMREHLPPDTLVSVGAAGAMPYASELPVVDAYGLVDPGVLEVAKPVTGRGARPGHQLYAPMSYIKSREPALLCHVGTDTGRPSPGAARRRAGRGYVWACVDVDTLETPRGPIAPFHYCCLRQRDTVVGPFGTPEEDRR
jgi:arabinofuranosyltransferase